MPSEDPRLPRPGHATPRSSAAPARASGVRQARLTRTRRIRVRTLAVTAALFLAVWGVIFARLVTGHDPALAASSRRVAVGASLSTAAATATADRRLAAHRKLVAARRRQARAGRAAAAKRAAASATTTAAAASAPTTTASTPSGAVSTRQS